MKPLADWQFDSSRPLQTKRGTAQALRCGDDKVDDLIERGLLEDGQHWSIGAGHNRVDHERGIKGDDPQPQEREVA